MQNIRDPMNESSEIKREVSFFIGKKKDKGHTGYLLFCTLIT